MEAGDRSVSLDLTMRSVMSMGAARCLKALKVVDLSQAEIRES